MRCQHCPLASAGKCVGEEPSTSFACTMAPNGLVSQLNWIRHASGEGETPPTAEPAAPPPPPYPPLVEQLRGLVASLAAWARSGFRLATSAEVRRRRGVCRGCPAFDAAQGRCRACGCMTSLKPWIAAASCPQGRWGPPGPS